MPPRKLPCAPRGKQHRRQTEEGNIVLGTGRRAGYDEQSICIKKLLQLWTKARSIYSPTTR